MLLTGQCVSLPSQVSFDPSLKKKKKKKVVLEGAEEGDGAEAATEELGDLAGAWTGILNTHKYSHRQKHSCAFRRVRCRRTRRTQPEPRVPPGMRARDTRVQIAASSRSASCVTYPLIRDFETPPGLAFQSYKCRSFSIPSPPRLLQWETVKTLERKRRKSPRTRARMRPRARRAAGPCCAI